MLDIFRRCFPHMSAELPCNCGVPLQVRSSYDHQVNKVLDKLPNNQIVSFNRICSEHHERFCNSLTRQSSVSLTIIRFQSTPEVSVAPSCQASTHRLIDFARSIVEPEQAHAFPATFLSSCSSDNPPTCLKHPNVSSNTPTTILHNGI